MIKLINLMNHRGGVGVGFMGELDGGAPMAILDQGDSHGILLPSIEQQLDDTKSSCCLRNSGLGECSRGTRICLLRLAVKSGDKLITGGVTTREVSCI